MPIPQGSQRLGQFQMHLHLVMGPWDIWQGGFGCYLLNVLCCHLSCFHKLLAQLAPSSEAAFSKGESISAIGFPTKGKSFSALWFCWQKGCVVQGHLLRDTYQHPAFSVPCCFSLLFCNQTMVVCWEWWELVPRHLFCKAEFNLINCLCLLTCVYAITPIPPGVKADSRLEGR